MAGQIVYVGDASVSLHNVTEDLWQGLAEVFTVRRFREAQWVEAFGEPGTLVIFGPQAEPCEGCRAPVWEEPDGRVTDADGPHTCRSPR